MRLEPTKVADSLESHHNVQKTERTKQEQDEAVKHAVSQVELGQGT